ncbi:MFS monosaccharide transporter [Aspergillus bombycis]|uniref:MFS monosaccharide transporter n=1 Tax=Aspergillus bombycis TaxID=109264 RepID=A0A1F7ZR89_9EURO|nr:MFS monosaccharide transporter [Aspergillus bombycis]OGM41937.1 MFS monosaccharide transporter [Aspergillus bombycis]
MPPLLANAGVGAVLYTSYLQVLGALYEPVSRGVKRIYPPASPLCTFTAGFAAGALQSIVAAPLDALQVRLRANDILEGQYRSMWHYGRHKLKQIGIRGIFAGWSLSFLRDAFGYGVFFSFFEYIKSQAYYSFITGYYGPLRIHYVNELLSTKSSDRDVPLIKPHYTLEPCFLMAAGVAASIAQQAIQHPLSIIQNLHVARLEYLDHQASLHPSRRQMLRLYYLAYQETYKRCRKRATRAGGWRHWLFRGFPITTVNITSPSSPCISPSIPLQSLQYRSQSSPAQSVRVHESASEKGSRRSSLSVQSVESEYSLWTGTGDLAEQLANEEDPLRIRLGESLDREISSRLGSRARVKQLKRVHYPNESNLATEQAEPEKTIEIPCPPPRHISRVERLLAVIMSPGNRQTAQMHGLVGKPLLYFTSVFVSLGVFLFGYDQGVMSGIITGWYFKDYFNQPSRAAIGTVVAILEVGAFISSLLVGRVGDLIGRRRTILYGSIVFFIGGALQTFANGLAMMMVGRIVAGLGVGALSTIVPVYQSEISPPHNRGKLACIEFTGNISGYAASVWVDYFCSFIDNNYSWRLPLLCQCIMGALLGLGSLIICESPRWLLDNDYDEEGMVVIANLYGQGDLHNDKARQEYRDIKMDVLLQRQEGERSYTDMFKRYKKRVLIAMSAQALAQLNGINVISYYAPLVFESAGWAGRDAILMTGINAISYLASTVPPWYLVDRWVYFLYPETSGVRLEDMDTLFGDATTAMPTPASQGERGSLMSVGSPVPSLDIRRQYGQFGPENAIPGLDIDPPTINAGENAKVGQRGSQDGGGRLEGLGGWISNMVSRHKGSSGQRLQGTQYRRLGQDDENE